MTEGIPNPYGSVSVLCIKEDEVFKESAVISLRDYAKSEIASGITETADLFSSPKICKGFH